MAAAATVDLAPLAAMAGVGLLLALVPLAWVLLRHRGAGADARLQALTWLAVFLTFDLVLVGAFTRLTDSGLGCPDWPGCYGHASPLGAQAHIEAAQSAMPSGPVTHGKAWVEMVHRYLASGVGVLIAMLAAAGWVRRWRSAGSMPAPWWATAALLWVCAQGAFGALTVTLRLYPAVVTLHLLGGIGLLALLAAQARPAGADPSLALPRRLRGGAWLVFALVVAQCALGAWVSSNYAVLACSDFPTCQGAWWPEMDFARGFTLQRPLGMGPDGAPIPFAALTAIHWVHRVGALVVLSATLLLAWRLALRREPAARRFARGLAGVAAWQLATGLGNVVLGWPLAAAVAHTGGAAVLVTLLAVLLARGHGAGIVVPAGSRRAAQHPASRRAAARDPSPVARLKTP